MTGINGDVNIAVAFINPTESPMKRTMLSAIAASVLTGAAFGVLAAGCETYAVSGSVETTNVAPLIQTGTINLVLTDANGEEVFNETGGVVGRVESQDLSTGTAILEHQIVFSSGVSLNTNDDVATINFPTSACTVFVTEVISNFGGTGLFRGAQDINITAAGEVYIAPCADPSIANQNSFELGGSVCLR